MPAKKTRLRKTVKKLAKRISRRAKPKRKATRKRATTTRTPKRKLAKKTVRKPTKTVKRTKPKKQITPRKNRPAPRIPIIGGQVKKPRDTCPECGSTNIVYSQLTDSTICQDCGGMFSELAPEEQRKFQRVAKS